MISIAVFVWGTLSVKLRYLILRAGTPPGSDFARGFAPDPYTFVEFSPGARTFLHIVFSSWSNKISDNNTYALIPRLNVPFVADNQVGRLWSCASSVFFCQQDDRSERPKRAVFASRDVTQWPVVSPPNLAVA